MGQASSVHKIDFQRYLGRWYELARYPNPFEIDCLRATADYININGNITVINTCYQKGSWHQNIGRLENTSNGYRVTFKYELSPDQGKVIQSFPGSYRILWTDYKNFALVGGGIFYWILSRKPTITQMDRRALIEKTVDAGYDPSKLIWN